MRFEGVEDEADVQRVLLHVEREVWPQLRLWEYSVIDVDRAMAGECGVCCFLSLCSLCPDFDAGPRRAVGSFEELLERMESKGVREKVGHRHGCSVDQTLASELFDSAQEFRKCVETINLHRYREWDDHRQAVLVNLGHRLRYVHLEEGGKGRPLFEPYFAMVRPHLYLACNGWTVGGHQDHAGTSLSLSLLSSCFLHLCSQALSPVPTCGGR